MISNKQRDDATPEQIAARYGVSDETVRRMLREKKIPGVKLGAVWRCNPVQVHEALVMSNVTPKKR